MYICMHGRMYVSFQERKVYACYSNYINKFFKNLQLHFFEAHMYVCTYFKYWCSLYWIYSLESKKLDRPTYICMYVCTYICTSLLVGDKYKFAFAQ